MHPRSLVGLFAVFSGLALPPAAAQETKSAVAFRPLTLEGAFAAAQAERKLVFIDFFTTWCAPCKLLDQQTWTDPKVGELVNAKAVALKLDAEKEGRAAAKHYAIAAYPTLLLLKPDGTEVDRIVGFRDPARFIADFAAGVAGRPTLVRAHDAVTSASADSPEAVRARYDLAKTLARAGQSAEALEHYLWCFDEGMIKVSAFTGVRTSFLTGDLGRLAAKYPPAREALVSRRDAAKTRLLEGDARAASDFAALNEALGDRAANLAMFDQLPAGDPRRRGFGTRVQPQLIAARRYAEALEVMPANVMLDIAKRAHSRMGSVAGDAATKRMSGQIYVAYVEVLAGSGDLAHARELIGTILAIDATEDTRALLRRSIERAECPELLEALAAKP
ncbi:MAG: thioredoxin family protein [Opitutaceae bacterium]|nr:thioredoxin family protein [Opitutaceae bacterium]